MTLTVASFAILTAALAIGVAAHGDLPYPPLAERLY
eukprot:gene9798-biopygen7389